MKVVADLVRPAEWHPTAVIDVGSDVGAGTWIWHFTHVMADARIGQGCVLGQNVFVASGADIGHRVKIQNNVSLYDGVTLEDDVFVGPSVVFTNVSNPRARVNRKHQYRKTLVRHGATIGANATIICGHTIGPNAFIGAGAVVVKDVPQHALVLGVPGRVEGFMCVCGERLHDAMCGVCLIDYEERLKTELDAFARELLTRR